MTAEATETTDGEEAELLVRYRFQQATHAGLLPDDAMEFAHSKADVGELRRLVLFGATPEQIAAIVL